MQTTKFLFVIGAVAILAAPLETTAASDTEAQAKMREALRQKMAELNAPATPAPAPAVPPPAVAKPTPPKAPAPVVIAPTVVVPVPVEPAKVARPAAPAPATQFSSEPPAGDNDQTAQMREALRQKIAAERAVAPAQPAPVVSPPVQPARTAPVSTPAPAPVVAPSVEPKTVVTPTPAPGPASKQDRLAKLLQLYRADSITPQQYHTQRAAIIAEP